MVSNLNAFYYSFILLFDSDGNLLKKLSFISQSSPNPTNLLYFEAYWFRTYDTQSVILQGTVMKAISLVGYSNSSNADQALIKLDNQGNLIWATAVDYNLYYDSNSQFEVYNSTIYSALYSNNSFVCFFSLEGVSGLMTNSKCYSFPYQSVSDISGKYLHYSLNKISLTFS